jgi:hypothetical protein
MLTGLSVMLMLNTIDYQMFYRINTNKVCSVKLMKAGNYQINYERYCSVCDREVVFSSIYIMCKASILL